MDKNYSVIRKAAVKLRKQGLSYGEIKKRIGISKSTLSLWLKSIPLAPKHRARLYTKQVQILTRGPQSQKERRKREIEGMVEKAKREIKSPLSSETHKLFGAALYWAEGGKTKSFEITNSDPYLVAFMVGWFKKVFNVPAKTMKAHLNIYPQQNELEVKNFWSDITGIPLDRFGKSFVKPPNKGFKKNNLYYGTIKVRVSKGTDMKHRVFGWIQAALQDISPKIELTQRKWIHLSDVERPPVNL